MDSNVVKQLNDFEPFLRFKPTWPFKQFIKCDQKIIALFTGNQYGKTGNVAYNYVLRIMGFHPVPEKNVVYFECECGKRIGAGFMAKDGLCPSCKKEMKIHERSTRIFRFASETLPGQTSTGKEEDIDSGRSEIKNTQYPEFRKWLPKFLIKRDITFRNPSIVIKDPHGGEDIVVEFVSYSQTVQQSAGVQRLSVWEDEEAPLDFHEEQIPRLVAEDGDLLISLTPANNLTWTYDDIFERAQVYYRSKTICDYANLEPVERTESKHRIAVIQAATDDNPTLNANVIETMFDSYDNPDVVSIRRYGIFKQVSGRIYKDFSYPVHMIDSKNYFPNGIFSEWTLARMIDYHEHKNWAIPFIALSPTNEAFIWAELDPSPEQFVTEQIAGQIAKVSGNKHFKLDIIDPLAAKTQTNTGTSVLDDLNYCFRKMRKEGVCQGAFWQTWDSKSTRGRDEIRKRLKNSKHCKKPFNNEVMKDGIKTYLPTLWIFNSCKKTAQSLRQWRLEEWAHSRDLITKDMKEKPQQKWSDFPTAIEAVFKDIRFKPTHRSAFNRESQMKSYFQGVA